MNRNLRKSAGVGRSRNFMPEELLRLDDFLQANKDRAAEEEFELNFKPDYLYTSNDEIKTLIRSGEKVFGVPAASLSWGIDGNRMKASLQPGIEGELHTAKLLDAFARSHPNTYVFHSLSWPESNGDTDHILVHKDMVIVIDSKRWKAQRKYSVTEKGAIKRGTVAFPQGRVKIGYALKAWRKKIPKEVKVHGIVCIAQQKVFVSRDKNWYKTPYRLVESEKLVEQLEYMISKHKPAVDGVSGALLMYLVKLLVKPRDPLEGLLNKEALM
jgi:hypothetical protein